MEMSGKLHAPAVFPQGKSPWHPLDRTLGEPRAVLDAVEKRKIYCPDLESEHGPSACRSLLYRLSYSYEQDPNEMIIRTAPQVTIAVAPTLAVCTDRCIRAKEREVRRESRRMEKSNEELRNLFNFLNLITSVSEGG
jgi:hypothetical protein